MKIAVGRLLKTSSAGDTGTTRPGKFPGGRVFPRTFASANVLRVENSGSAPQGLRKLLVVVSRFESLSGRVVLPLNIRDTAGRAQGLHESHRNYFLAAAFEEPSA